MSFKDLSLLGLTSLIILLTGSSAIFSSRTVNLSKEENCEFPPLSLLQLKDGDVILRKGNSVFSELIARNFPAAEVCLIAVLFLRLMTNIR